MSGLSRRRSKNVRITARIAAGALLVAAAVTGLAGVASAAGNNGTVKLGSAGIPPTDANDPHLSCPIQIQWSGFDKGTQTFDVSFTGINPTGGTIAPATAHGTFDGSTVHTETYSLVVTGAKPHNGEIHVGIDITTTAASGSQFKQKTVWLQSCGTSGGSVDITGTCNSTFDGYDWTVTATPTNP